jgi:hypothetical protein
MRPMHAPRGPPRCGSFMHACPTMIPARARAARTGEQLVDGDAQRPDVHLLVAGRHVRRLHRAAGHHLHRRQRDDLRVRGRGFATRPTRVSTPDRLTRSPACQPACRRRSLGRTSMLEAGKALSIAAGAHAAHARTPGGRAGARAPRAPCTRRCPQARWPSPAAGSWSARSRPRAPSRPPPGRCSPASHPCPARAQVLGLGRRAALTLTLPRCTNEPRLMGSREAGCAAASGAGRAAHGRRSSACRCITGVPAVPGAPLRVSRAVGPHRWMTCSACMRLSAVSSGAAKAAATRRSSMARPSRSSRSSRSPPGQSSMTR